MISMRNSEALRKGADLDENRVGFFEKFTKGVGRKILEKQGWSDGRGVGVQEGILEPISQEWKNPHDRSGFGYAMIVILLLVLWFVEFPVGKLANDRTRAFVYS